MTLESPPAAPPATALRVSGLAKAFGPTQALRSCSFDLARGEVHAIVGENGSGKSTLVKVLAGVHHPDAGELELDGTARAGLRSPAAALDAGIVTVFQEVLVLGPRSVLDNVWLGSDGLLRERVGRRERVQRAREVLTELLGEAPDLGVPVEELSLSDQQACGIARALVRRARVLILDEATSALDVATRGRLFDIVRRLKDEGVATIFISHRMDEIDEISDRVTVLRSGASVATLARDQATTHGLVALMTGSQQLTEHARSAERPPGAVVLRAGGVTLRPDARPIDFALRAGEIVGLAGLEGSGQDTFLRALWGMLPGAGRVVREDGERGGAAVTSPATAAAHGIAYVPRDRRGESMFESLSIRENFGLPTLARDARGGVVNPGATARRLAAYVDRLRIKLADPRNAMTTLSGGNQQKVVIARWLAADPRVLLLNDPTRGVDLGAKRDIYNLLARLAEQGVAIVMLSTEVDEHVELMDRVLVFHEHEVFAELERARLSRDALVSSFFGREVTDHA